MKGGTEKENGRFSVWSQTSAGRRVVGEGEGVLARESETSNDTWRVLPRLPCRAP